LTTPAYWPDPGFLSQVRLPSGAEQGTCDERDSAMSDLTPEGRRLVDDIAQRHGFGTDAVLALLRALVAGGGTMAQFSHPELGGTGQWSRGGMLMIGDMFNDGLKARVDAVCSELAGFMGSRAMFASGGQSQSQQQGVAGGSPQVSLFVAGAGGSSGQWWPEGLGSPSSTGTQNDLRYALFPGARRLAIQRGGAVTVYDTGDHIIGGFSQQQSGDQSLTFTSQFGLVRVADLPVVDSGRTERPPAPSAAPAPPAPMPPARAGATAPAGPASQTGESPLAIIEKLADLHQKGILSAEEFAAKKAELLSRL
jgi:Short C-terminal domain